jgi:hypothetical protein
MGSKSKRQMTAAKRAREQARKDRRERKEEKKRARAQVAAQGLTAPEGSQHEDIASDAALDRDA